MTFGFLAMGAAKEHRCLQPRRRRFAQRGGKMRVSHRESRAIDAARHRGDTAVAGEVPDPVIARIDQRHRTGEIQRPHGLQQIAAETALLRAGPYDRQSLGPQKRPDGITHSLSLHG